MIAQSGAPWSELQAKPLRIEITDQPSGIGGRIVQYYGIEGVAAMEAKLAQFARGTEFVMYTSGAGAARAEIRRFAGERGIAVTMQ